MSRLGLGLGLNLPRPIYFGGGGSSPTIPLGYTGRYLSYYSDDIQTVTGNDVEQWDDRSTFGNDLTQTTAGNRFVFVENNLLTQTNASNQPTLIDTGVEGLALNFPQGNYYMTGFSNDTDDFTLEWDADFIGNNDERFLSYSGNSIPRLVYNGGISIFADVSGVTSFSGVPDLVGTRNKMHIIKSGNNLSLYINEVQVDTTKDVTGKTYRNFDSIGHARGFGVTANCNLFNFKIYPVAVADVTNITETPSYSLIPTLDSIPSGLNNPAPKAYLEEYNQFDNVLRGDAVNDYMEGIQPEAGDFALVFKKKANTLATVKTLFSSSTTSAEIRTNVSDQIEVLSDDGTVFTYTLSTVLNEQQVTIIQLNGTNLELYESSTLLQSLDVTGKTFTIDLLAMGTASCDSDWQEITPYPNYLSQSDLNYFYFIRDTDNNIILVDGLPILTV